MCEGGWYTRHGKDFRRLRDMQLAATMGVSGHGPPGVSPRLVRHFHVLRFEPFPAASLQAIFNTIVAPQFERLTGAVRSLEGPLVAASVALFHHSFTGLLPTPGKSHYSFNLRDLSSLVRGVLRAPASAVPTKAALARLWAHESARVFADRLVDEADRTWVHERAAEVCWEHFRLPYAHVVNRTPPPGTYGPEQGTADTGGSGERSSAGNEAAPEAGGDFPLFCDFLEPGAPPEARRYVECTDRVLLFRVLSQSLAEYNELHRSPMDLVLFAYAVDHLCRVSRALSQPRGHALLVGVGGSGRRSAVSLAAFMAGMTVRTVELSKGYGPAEWREDMRALITEAGTAEHGVALLLDDSQLAEDVFAEDVNTLLNGGELPSLFSDDERQVLCDQVAGLAARGGVASAAAPDLFAFFLRNAADNLHVGLCMSPLHPVFRQRLRMFPSFVNCCTIDWCAQGAAPAARGPFRVSVGWGSRAQSPACTLSPQVRPVAHRGASCSGRALAGTGHGLIGWAGAAAQRSGDLRLDAALRAPRGLAVPGV